MLLSTYMSLGHMANNQYKPVLVSLALSCEYVQW